MVTFTVVIEDEDGTKIATFHNVRTQTKKEAINKAKASLTYTAMPNFVEAQQPGTIKAKR
jgi:hypothetical protein